KSAVDEGKVDTFIMRQVELRGEIQDLLTRDVGNLKIITEQLQEPAHPAGTDLWRKRLKDFILYSVLGSIALSLALAVFFARSITRRLTLLKENALLLARGAELHEALSGSDEIAKLDNAFHDMAKTLAEAARRERALVDNALDVICSIDEKRIFTAVSPA